jgi:hypothetical protein
MDTEAEERDAIIDGTLPARVERYNYDGDLNAAEVVQSATGVEKFVNDIATKLKTGDLTAAQISEIKEKLAGLVTPRQTGPKLVVEEHSPDIASTNAV